MEVEEGCSVKPKQWSAWHRNTLAEAWSLVLVGQDERDVITRTNELRLPGDVLVLPGGNDPNRPQKVHSVGRHNQVASAVARGRSMERALARRWSHE